MEIYFRDLTPEAQRAVMEIYGSEEENNWDIIPLFTLPIIDEE
jgi:hypothetical protein